MTNETWLIAVWAYGMLTVLTIAGLVVFAAIGPAA